MSEGRKRLLSNSAWVLVWAIVTLVTFLVYPGVSALWGGWFPVSALKTFGMMVVILITAIFFVKDMLKLDSD